MPTRTAGTASSAPRLADAIVNPAPKARLHVVTGKGGTGKTTVAAALALAIAGLGKRVLLVEVESRQALAQLFHRPPMPYAEEKLSAAPNGGELYGLAIDAEEAMLEYLEMFYGLKRAGKGLKRLGAVDFVTTLAPGLRDVLLTGKVKESVVRVGRDGDPKQRAYDAVVLDAPPTGRITRFLDATREVAKLARIGPIHRQSDGVIQLLHGPQTVVHLVTLLEEMPVQETIDAAAELQRLDFQLGAVIVNRARPALLTSAQLGADDRPDAASLSAGLAAAGFSDDQVGAYADALASEVADYARRQRLEAEGASRLDGLDMPRITLPDLNPPVELGELKDLAARFTTAGAR
ncbi:P-loop NTPase family protein [Jatrophihabitans fulvus]